MFQNRFGAGDQIGGGNDFVDQSDAPGFLGTDDFAGKDELQGSAFANQSRQPLCSTGAGQDSKFHFGLSEFRRLRSDPSTRKIPILIISALDDPESRTRAAQAGATAYYTKPFSPIALLKEIDRLKADAIAKDK